VLLLFKALLLLFTVFVVLVLFVVFVVVELVVVFVVPVVVVLVPFIDAVPFAVLLLCKATVPLVVIFPGNIVPFGPYIIV
jgi:hypothetical protein